MKFEDFLKKVESKEKNSEIVLGNIYNTDIHGYVIPIAKSETASGNYLCLLLDSEAQKSGHKGSLCVEDFNFKIGDLFLFIFETELKEII